MPAVTGIHHFSLTVCDLQRSIDWYCDLLGLEKVLEEPHPDGTGTGVMRADQAIKLLIEQHHLEDTAGGRFSESRTGLYHAVIGVSCRAEFVQWQQRLEERAVRHSPITD